MRSYTTTILFTILFVAAAIAWLQSMATDLYWYWIYWWFDIPMHVLGGFMVGLIAVFVLGRFSAIPLRGFKQTMIVVGVALFVGVLWEIFEWWAGVFVIHEPFPDTIHDLFADVAGGLSAYVYAVFIQYITTQKQQ